MKKILLIAAIFSLTACANQTGQYGSNESANGEIKAATAAWAEAFNSRNPAHIAGFYAPGAVFWGTTSKSIRSTPADIADYFKDAGKRPDARVTIGEQYVRVYGDIGLNTGSYTFSDSRDGQSVSRPARFSMAFQKRAGTWVLVDHHSSEVK